jgi:GWxTD domain-containing protein
MALTMPGIRGCLSATILMLAVLPTNAWAQAPGANPQQSSPSEASPQQSPDPLKRPPDENRHKQQEKQLRKELGKGYRIWRDEDVRWIISDAEKRAFDLLSNDQERDQFIEEFWFRRDPTPDTLENEFKEEHYRRMTYANEHFAAGVPGWRTDRGRIYIMYGSPDQIDSHPSGGLYERTQKEGGGTTSAFPFEIWRYRYLNGNDLGQEIEIEFVDDCMCGVYRMTMDPLDKDALRHVPGSAPQQTPPAMSGNDQFGNLRKFAALSRAPEVKFNDLHTQISHIVRTNLLPFDVRADFMKVTNDTVLVPITVQVQNKDISWTATEGVEHMALNVVGHVSTLTGRTVQTFDDTVTDMIPSELLPKVSDKSHVYWKALPLHPGHYRLDLVLKDLNGDRLGAWSRSIVVPEYSEDKLAASSLILADLIEKVPAKVVNVGNFVLGDTKVRPRVEPSDGRPAMFKRSQPLHVWMQVYNLAMDKQKHNAAVEYEIVNISTKKTAVDVMDTSDQLAAAGDQITLIKTLALAQLEPGTYQITIKVTDKISSQKISPAARFSVE